jgi:hypothetical protein
LLMGDVNGDGSYTIIDVILCVQYIMGLIDLEEDEIYRSDLNFDGEINLFDVLNIVDVVAN